MRNRSTRKIFEHLDVTDAGAKGKAIAKAPDGKVVFIPNAIPGDVVTVQTTKSRKAYYEANAIEFHEYSKQRVTPICKHFGTCGGCKWQHMAYGSQLFYKQKEVEQNLLRIGGLDLPDTLPIIGAPEPYYYRNKMEYSFSNAKWLTKEEIENNVAIDNKNALGVHIPRFWDKILDLDECHLQDPLGNTLRLFIKDKAETLGLSFFDPRGQSGHLRTLMLRNTTKGQWMVLIQFYEDDAALRTGLLSAIADKFPEVTSLLYVINQKGNDTIYDQEVHCFKGTEYIVEQMGSLEFHINAKSFYQTNSVQAHHLYQVVRDFAQLSGHELVYDLYTGTGTIAQFVADQAQKVIGIESVPEAIEAAKANAKRNGIDNVSFYVGDMKMLFTSAFIDAHGTPEVVITDPPRDGMHKDVVAQLLALGPQRIVYVSCNSATQARDLAMMKQDYKISKMQPVDMFPQTYHVENVVLLEKIKA